MSDDGKNRATHVLLSGIADIWVADETVSHKTNFLNFMVRQINAWIAWREPDDYPQQEQRERPERPKALYGQLGTRVWNEFVNGNYESFADMAKETDSQLLHAPNFGRKSLAYFREFMDQEIGVAPPSEGDSECKTQ